MRVAETLAAQKGAQVSEEIDLAALGLDLAKLESAEDFSLNALRSDLRAQGLKVAVARNTGFRPAATLRNYALPMVGFGTGAGCPMPSTVRVGLIDGPIDLASPALRGIEVRIDDFTGGAAEGSTAHATGIATLIASRGYQDFPPGLAQGAPLFAAAVFKATNGADSANAAAIAQALDWMVQNHVQVVNLSLAGPENEVLAEVIGKAAQKGLIMVAAVGNDGVDRVAFPASDPNVFGVTAIDVRKKRFPAASFGPEVDFAAPGVDLAVYEGAGPAYRSGTSYATAIATAIIARVIADGTRDKQGIYEQIKRAAEDLGDPGFDERYGWGLMKSENCSK